jgi:phosphoserine phosphatase
MADSTPELEAKIDALYAAAKQLQTERDNLNEKARGFRDRRDQLNGEVRELIDKANEFRGQRDKLNAQIKANKQRRDEATEAAKVTRKKMGEMGLDTRSMPRIRSEEEIEEEIQRLEWQIQTNVMSIPRERKLVDQVEKLGKEKAESRALREKLVEAGDKRIEVDALRISSSKLHSQILALSKESQQSHQKMIEVLEQAKPNRKEADANHRKMLESIREADEKHAELMKVRQSLGKMVDREKGIERKKEERRSFATDRKMRKRAEEALERLRAGQKVELDELMLLKEFGLM